MRTEPPCLTMKFVSPRRAFSRSSSTTEVSHAGSPGQNSFRPATAPRGPWWSAKASLNPRIRLRLRRPPPAAGGSECQGETVGLARLNGQGSTALYTEWTHLREKGLIRQKEGDSFVRVRLNSQQIRFIDYSRSFTKIPSNSFFLSKRVSHLYSS